MSRRFFEISVIVFAIVGAMSFFKLWFIGENLIKYIQLGSLGIIFLLVIIEYIYNKEERFYPFFRKEIFFILLSLLLSSIIAFQAHQQAFGITLIAQRVMYFYVFYFMLHALRIRPSDLERIIVGMGIVIAIFYLIQYVLYPRILFNVRISKERGTLRIFMAGISFTILTFFYALVHFFKNWDFRWGAVLFLTLMIIVFLGTRQILFSVMLIALFWLISSKQIKSKFILIPLGAIMIIPVFFLFRNIITEMLNVSKQQSTDSDSIQRTKTITFFLFEFFPNKMAYLLGNGMDSQNSPYGIKMYHYMINQNYYLSDIGIIGNYVRYGALFVLSVFSIIIKVFRYKISPGLIWIKLYFAMVTLLLLTGGDFGDVYSFVPLLLLLYLIDVDLYDKTEKRIRFNASFQ